MQLASLQLVLENTIPPRKLTSFGRHEENSQRILKHPASHFSVFILCLYFDEESTYKRRLMPYKNFFFPKLFHILVLHAARKYTRVSIDKFLRKPIRKK